MLRAKPPRRQLSVTAFRSPWVTEPEVGGFGDAVKWLRMPDDLCRAP